VIEKGEFTEHRSHINESFHCLHCQNRKKSKVTFTWNGLGPICNGCRGEMLKTGIRENQAHRFVLD